MKDLLGVVLLLAAMPFVLFAGWMMWMLFWCSFKHYVLGDKS